MKLSTIAIHKGQDPDPQTGAVITPIYQTTTFGQTAPGEMIAGYDYSRSGNPTRDVLETVLAEMEGGAYGFTFSSGMSALSTLALSFLKAGDRVILGDDVYGGTFRLFDKVLKRFGIDPVHVDMGDLQAVEAAITPETKLLFLETPTNPMLKLADLEGLIKLAKSHDLLTCVDNTFATPYLQQPLKFGADMVMHSTTKYINGHSDVVGGALIVQDQTHADTIRFHQNAVGATPDPLACWLTLRGLKTLGVRMERHVKSAQTLAEFLEAHDAVESVIYPGLESHPDYELAKRQMNGAGGMISMRIKGDTTKFLQSLKYFILAESLGGVESLIEVPAIMTHASLNAEDRAALGITDNLIRMSVGIEDVEDLQEDLQHALSASVGNNGGRSAVAA